jgi:hypothetical protein
MPHRKRPTAPSLQEKRSPRTPQCRFSFARYPNASPDKTKKPVTFPQEGVSGRSGTFFQMNEDDGKA